MNAYNQFPHSEQEIACHVENLSVSDIIGNSRESFQFLGRLSNPRRHEQCKWAIITLWQNDEITTEEAIWWLDQCGFIRIDAEPEYASALLEGYVVHEKRLAEGARS